MSGSSSKGPAIVTTLADAGAVLDSFVAYHLAIGFSHLYLFFDDPADPDFERFQSHPGVTATLHNATLREAWTHFPELDWCVKTADQEVMSRQILNARLAMDMAKDDGIDWLLHIDSDELFYSAEENAAAHFAKASASGVDTIAYHNHEAVPEIEEAGDFFKTVTLFKVSGAVFIGRGGQVERLGAASRGLRYFNYYDMGKSAVRLSAPGMQFEGVHGFGRPGGFKRRQAVRQVILHYACCGLDALWRKYKRLGAFDDRWWNAADIAASVPFHIQARNAVAEGYDAARRLYQAEVMLDDPMTIRRLQAEGVLERITGPADILKSLKQPG